MRSSPKTLLLCAVSLVALCGFGGTRDCASDDVRKTVVKIVKQHPPSQLLTTAGETWSLIQKKAIEQECGKPYTEACYRPALETLAQTQRLMNQDASYDIDNIRLTDRNEATGDVSCAADLHVVLPKNWGSAAEPIAYSVEKVSGEDEFNVTIRALR